MLPPQPLTKNNGYIIGLFMADGSISMNCRPSAKDKKTKAKFLETSEKPFKESRFEKKIKRALRGVGPLIQITISNKYKQNVADISVQLNCQGGDYFFERRLKKVLGFIGSLSKKKLVPILSFHRGLREFIW